MRATKEAQGLAPKGLKMGTEIEPLIDSNPESDAQVFSPYGIALLQFDWGHPTESQTEWLVSRGVGLEALLKPWPIGAACVKFEGNYFEPDKSGVNAITFVAFNCGIPIDIVAWQPKTGELGTYFCRAIFLGDEDDCINPATWIDGDDLCIHATPLEWLQANREGVVILNETRAGEILRRVKSVRCNDDDMAATVYRWIQPTQPLTKYLLGNCHMSEVIKREFKPKVIVATDRARLIVFEQGFHFGI